MTTTRTHSRISRETLVHVGIGVFAGGLMGVAVVAGLTANSTGTVCRPVAQAVQDARQATNAAFDTYEISIVGYQNGFDLGAGKLYMDALVQRVEAQGAFVQIENEIASC